ncbi:MAG TPA: ATP-binding protein [Anaerovoracaceae bacterium]|nr:ATP-binding protein [Anaerovoracaceae bacterium]
MTWLQVSLYLSFVLAAGACLLLGRLAGLPFLPCLAAALVFSGAQIFCFRLFVKCHSERGKSEEKMITPPVDAVRTSGQENGISTETRALIAENSELTSFNFTISHEIKAPVRAIDGYARIFLEDYGQTLDPEARGMVEIIRSICKETIALTNKLLEYTRIAQNKPTSEVVDLEGMMRDVFDSLYRPSDNEYPVRFAIDSAVPHVLGDPVLLRLAIVNIVSNSLKFMRGKKEGRITVGSADINGEDVFYIRDNGTGFDMQYSEKLFSMFERMHSSDEFEGSGVGLAIVKKIILLHKGRVWITGKVGGGATVYFTLPRETVLR